MTHKGIISSIIESQKMTPEESVTFIKKYEKELNLSKKQHEHWAGKRYLAVYGISDFRGIDPFQYKSEKNMDDWIITDDISKIKIE